MPHSVPPGPQDLHRRIETLEREKAELTAELRRLRIRETALETANQRAASLLDSLQRARGDADDARRRERAVLVERQRLVSSLGHELRTPLGGVLGVAQLLAATVLDDEQRRMLDVLQQSGLRLLDAVQNALDFAELETGRIQIEPTPTAPRALLRAVVTQLGDRVSSEVQLHVRWEDGVPDHLEVDAARLQQLLKLVIGQALESTHRGRVLLRVSYGETTARGKLHFELSDTRSGSGSGNDNAAPARAVSGQFAREAAEDAQRLGPSVARRLVEAFDGEMEPVLHRAGGTVTRFWVPTRLAAAPSTRVLTDSDAGSPGYALVVDDVATDLVVAQKLLESLRWEVSIAHDGAEALALRATFHFDLVLMDCQMPRLDGYEATRRWRALEPASEHTLIVAVTANAQPVDRVRCTAAGMDDFLPKPLRREQLLGLLAKWRGNAGSFSRTG